MTNKKKSAKSEVLGDARFTEVITLVEAAKGRAYQAVNSELVSLYWSLGEYISRKIESAEWGDGVVKELAETLSRRFSGQRGFNARNLFRMRQFYEAYRGHKKVSPLVTQLPWTHHLLILSAAKPPESREFHMLAAIDQRWSKRELERQIRTGGALRSLSLDTRVSALPRQLAPTALAEFKNAYNLEFLGLPAGHAEADLHRALLENLGRFLSELGRDFCFVGSEYPVQVGDPGLRDRPRLLPPPPAVPRRLRAEDREVQARRPRPALVLRRGPRPGREAGARAALHRRAALRDEGRRGRGVRTGAHDVAHAGRRIRDAAAAQRGAPREASRAVRAIEC